MLLNRRNVLASAILLSLCLGGIGAGYWAGHGKSSTNDVQQHPATNDVQQLPGTNDVQRHPTRHLREPSLAGNRGRIRAAIEDASASVHNSQELQVYLSSLEARAKKQGYVTALEVEPGMAMIRRIQNNEDDVRIFAERMMHLQSTSDPASAGDSLDK